jgi:hypothetical protein
MFAPLIFIFGFGAMINRVSAAGAQTLFYVFAALMGLSISWIFAAFTGISIAQTFLVTSIAFAGLSLYGYTTKKDISGWGAFLIMGLIGLIVAMIVNIFLGSPAIAFAISVIGLLIFAGLTAYDTQRLKTEYVAHAAACGPGVAGQVGDHGGAEPLPQLHQHLHVPASVHGQPRVTDARPDMENPAERAVRRGFSLPRAAPTRPRRAACGRRRACP